MLRVDMHTFSDESDRYFGISARLEEDAPGPAACGCGIRDLAVLQPHDVDVPCDEYGRLW